MSSTEQTTIPEQQRETRSDGDGVGEDERAAKVVELTPQQVFYTEFLKAQKELNERVEGLKDVAAPERGQVVQDIQREIVAWNDKIADAKSFLPGYDLRSYSETLKTLLNTLTKTRDSLSSKPKFSFKSKAAKAKAEKQPVATPKAAKPESIGPPPPTDPSAFVLDSSSASLLRSPSTPYTALHITNLSNVLLNHHKVPPSSTAALLKISNSLILLSPIHGPIHITHVTNSILILPYAHQVRIHDCNNVTVLYSARSEPVIERCRGMKFGKLPQRWVGSDGQSAVGGIQDFDWLKVGKNPHWDLVDGELLSDEMCGRIEGCREEGEVEGILRNVGVQKS